MKLGMKCLTLFCQMKTKLYMYTGLDMTQVESIEALKHYLHVLYIRHEGEGIWEGC